jgi:hypothetical protein
VLLKSFHKVQKEGILPNIFYEQSMTLILMSDKDTSIKESYRSISLMQKSSIKYLQNESKNTLKRSYAMTK